MAGDGGGEAPLNLVSTNMVSTNMDEVSEQAADSADRPSTERFRLRRFVDGLVASGEAELRDEPVALADISAGLHGNPNAVLFRKAGPEAAEVVGNVMGSRARLAEAFGVPGRELMAEVLRRLEAPQPVIEIPSQDAPVQAEVLIGDDADLTRLPVPFQHRRDGGPYISATLDYVRDEATGLTNVGYRRLMLRGRRETGIDLIAPSDLRAIYLAASSKGENLPVSFVLGAHPADHVAATMRLPGDETELVARLRGAPLPVVRCRTNDLLVPADAEIVLEGYLDAAGHVEPEGPYGEFLGYYGVVKQNPVFHLTAITRREDALFQTSTIGGKYLGCTDSAQLIALRTETSAWRSLANSIPEPVAVYATTASGGSFNLRVAIRQRSMGDARNAIAAVFGVLANVKNVFVVDDDIDVFSDEQIEWCMATRFQPDRDLMVEGGFRTLPLDPSLDGARTGSKAGFDLTLPMSETRPLSYTLPAPPRLVGPRFDTVRAALEDGPKIFEQLMTAIASRDGRDVVLALDALRDEGVLTRREEGEYALDEAGA